MNVKYIDTLNLPKTKFKMKANLPINEPNIIEHWNEINLYNIVKFNKFDDVNKLFVISDGPPYANGSIHLGHALNKILKDIINKFKILAGYKIIYVPGWDCHGLPIELNVEKKIGMKYIDVKTEEFIIACRIYANFQIEKQKYSFIRLGIFADWKKIYLTMNYDFESSILDNLSKIIKNNNIYRGKKPVYWCIFCASALAEAEVEYFDKKSNSIDVLFSVHNTNLIEVCYYLRNNFVYLGYESCNFIIWTTTDWTIPANEAVAINYEIIYVLFQVFNNRFIIAEKLLISFINRCGIKYYKLIAKCKGYIFLNKILLIHPIFNKIIPLVFSNHVNLDTGTGCVHISPGHGYDDYIVGKKYGMPIFSVVDEVGRCVLPGEFFNIPIEDLSNVVIKFLYYNYKLLSCNVIVHSYPYCWRHKKFLIFRSTYQFFISMEKNNLRNDSLKNIDIVKWYPNCGINRIKSMIESRPDWCISRQRVWGVPISLFINNKDLKIHPYTLFILKKIVYLISKYGISVWRDNNIKYIINDDNYEQILDTLDVWFDSGSVYNYQKNYLDKLFFSSDLYLEGSDQHRGWFQTSLLLSVANESVAPYKEVLTHGFVLDAFGNKMSKSLGNIITPEKIVNDFGADIIRLWVSSVNFQFDVNISSEILKRVIESYRKIRNTIKFLLSNIYDFDDLSYVDFNNLLKIDKWIINYSIVLKKNIMIDYNNYNFHNVYHKIQNFCINELGGFYLDIVKDRQYTCKQNCFARKSSQIAIFYVLNFILKCIAPILCFTSEEAWKFMPGIREKSVFLFNNSDIFDIHIYEKMSFDFWKLILTVKNLVNQFLENYRKFYLIGSALDLDIYLYCTIDLYLLLFRLQNELRFVFIASNVILKLIDNGENYIWYNFYDNFKFYVDIKKSIYLKCERCWHRTLEVKNGDICTRCVVNLSYGEKRSYL
ncbi:MAG: isoleucine--tRNA ligase [Candidatus Azosocius agrarius]|nr:MAG: isoleucine--tRNA ligase [Gammaproteobacteria bacterium]